MSVMIASHPSETNATKNEVTIETISSFSAKSSSSEKSGVQAKRIYFVDNQPVTVDTSKQGWAVDLLLKNQ